MKWQWEEMFTMKLVVSSLESVMQATERDINVIHHIIDSCRTKDSKSQHKGYLDKKRLLSCKKLLFLDNGTVYCGYPQYNTVTPNARYTFARTFKAVSKQTLEKC